METYQSKKTIVKFLRYKATDLMPRLTGMEEKPKKHITSRGFSILGRDFVGCKS